MAQESMPPKQPKDRKSPHAVKYYFDVLSRAEKALARQTSPPKSKDRIDIEQEIAREHKLKNDNAEQDIRLKRSTLNRLFVFLVVETALIFTFALFQAVHWPHNFHLEDWSFKLLTTATIAQIAGMLLVAVRYLFPAKNTK